MASSLRGAGMRLYRISGGSRRSLATSTFADMYRNSVSSVPVSSGDNLVGRIVGRRRPRSTSSQFSVVDFGLKSEAPFAKAETAGASAIGDEVTKPLIETEDEFNEPSFDHDHLSALPDVLAKRYRALTSASSAQPQFLYGRLSGFKRGGASAKVLGFDAFSPRHHVLAIKTPAIGSFCPLYLLSLVTSKRNTGSATAMPGLDVNPVVSSYGGILFSLANLVGFDDAWKASGGGSGKERIAYLQLLTRVLVNKNAAVRRALPRHAFARQSPTQYNGTLRSRRGATSAKSWLDDFPEVWQQKSNRGQVARMAKALHPGLRQLPSPREHPPPRAGAQNYEQNAHRPPKHGTGTSPEKKE